MEPTQPADTAIHSTIDRETDLLTSAVNLVASGAARSATVAGLRLADVAISIVRPLATDRGLVLEPLWGPDESGCDVRIRHAPAG